MAAENNSNRDVDIDLARLALGLWERRGRIVLVTAFAGLAALTIANLVPPLYKGETRILIESRSAPFETPRAAAPGNEPLLDELNIASQSQVMQSVDLIKTVAEELKLYEREEFDPPATPFPFSALLAALGLYREPLDVPPQERVLKAFREKLQVYRVETSRVIAVEFSSRDPLLAAAIPNAMAKAYLALQSGAKLDTSSEAAKWLEPEIATLRDKVREADKKVADYRASTDLARTGQEGNSFATRQLGDISTELARVRVEKANAEARALNVRNALAAGRPLDSLPEVAAAPMIQRLKENEAAVQGQISDLAASLLDAHPRLRALRAQLAGIRKQLDTEARKVAAGLQGEANVALLRETQLVAQLNGLKTDSARAGEQEVGLNDLQRDAAAQRQLLETYLARYREAASRAGSQQSAPADARIISAAIEPREPYFPKTGVIVTVVSLAAFLLSSIVILLVELFSGRALRPLTAANGDAPGMEEPRTEPMPAETLTPINPLVSPAPEEPPAQAAARQMGMPDDFSVDGIAEFLARRGAKPVVAVISPGGDEGSTATVMLARAICERGRSVVLVDMTATAAPTRLMAAESGLKGIMDLLGGEAALGEAIHPDRLSGAHIVPQGNAGEVPVAQAMERLAMIIGALTDAYETVLVECGAVQIDNAVKMLGRFAAEIVVSVPDGDAQAIEATLMALAAHGYGEAIPMAGEPRRRRAA